MYVRIIHQSNYIYPSTLVTQVLINNFHDKLTQFNYFESKSQYVFSNHSKHRSYVRKNNSDEKKLSSESFSYFFSHHFNFHPKFSFFWTNFLFHICVGLVWEWDFPPGLVWPDLCMDWCTCWRCPANAKLPQVLCPVRPRRTVRRDHKRLVLDTE